jgi:glycosyltransferase involved in cell wall biosynthesis
MPSAYRALEGLREGGFDVHVVMPSDGPVPSTYRGLNLHSFAVPRFGLEGSYGLERSPLLLQAPDERTASLRWKGFLGALLAGSIRIGHRVARRHRPDLLYGILPTGALAASALGGLLRRPNVTRLFGTHLAPVQGLRLLGHLWELAAFKAPADLIVLTNDGTLGDDVARRLRVPPERVRFLMNGVDEAFFLPSNDTEQRQVKESLGLHQSTALVVFAHHLISSHRAEVLVDAVGEARRRGVDVAAVVAGDGPERPALEARIAAAGVSDRLLLLGNVSRSRIQQLLAASDAVVSLDELSNVVNSVLEGLAAGVPVIATATGDTRSLLTDGVDAIVLSRPDPHQLADALTSIATDPELGERLRAGARATASRRLQTWPERMAFETTILRKLIRS